MFVCMYVCMYVSSFNEIMVTNCNMIYNAMRKDKCYACSIVRLNLFKTLGIKLRSSFSGRLQLFIQSYRIFIERNLKKDYSEAPPTPVRLKRTFFKREQNERDKV